MMYAPMRLLVLCVAFAFSGCVTIHTIDLGAQRASLGPNCNVPMNRGGQVPSGWSEIGRVQIDGASDWTEEQFADEFRQAACDMGAEYVVVTGGNQFIEAKFLMQAQASGSGAGTTGASQQQDQTQVVEQPPALEGL